MEEALPGMPGRRCGPVAFFMPNFEGGGAERMMTKLAAGVGRSRPAELVVANGSGPYRNEVPPHVRVVDLKARGVLAGLPHLVHYLRSARPVALIATLPHANVVAVLAARLSNTGVPVFVREASTPSIVEPQPWDWRGWIMPWFMRRSYRHATQVVAVSEGVAGDVAAFLGVSPDRISTIYNPVVDGEMQRKAGELLRHPWFEPGRPPVILSVGRLGPEKDFPTLLRAFALVLEEKEARLLILGEGRERQTLEKLIGELGLEGKVQLPGFVSNPFPYMAAAAVYALSSKREGLPGALIQALACGCSVVSTDCPNGPGEVLQGGRYGELVPVGAPAEMAAAILRVLKNPFAPFELRARAEYFSEERSVRAYLDLVDRARHTATAGASDRDSVGVLVESVAGGRALADRVQDSID